MLKPVEDKDLTCLAGSLRHCAGLGHGPAMEAVLAACLCGGAGTASSARQSIDTDKLKNVVGRKQPYDLRPVEEQPVLNRDPGPHLSEFICLHSNCAPKCELLNRNASRTRGLERGARTPKSPGSPS